MAHPDEIENLPALLQKVAGEIGALIDRGSQPNNGFQPAFEGPGAAVASPPEVEGALTIWRLSPAAYRALQESSLRGDILDWAVPTRLLHHQILLNGQAAGFARSVRPARNDKSLVHFSASPLAMQIQEALNKIEEQNGNEADPIVRLLEVPAYHILALWLFYGRGRESDLVVINAAKRFNRLKPNSRLTSTEFFEDLAKGGPILGVA